MDRCEDCGATYCRNCRTHYCCEPCPCERTHTCACECDRHDTWLTYAD